MFQTKSDRIDGKVCMVTGPTSGIGQEVALELASLGAKLILVGRNPEKCEQLKQSILTAGGEAPEVIICDMGSMKQVAQAARQFLDLHLPLHILVNNAGLLNQRRIETDEGLEQAMAVNYFSAFQLTLSLLDCMKKSAPARIINVTSSSYPVGKINFEDLNFERSYGPIKSYAASKLATIHFTRLLAKKLEDTQVTANVYNPKMIYTNLAVGNNAGKLVSIADFFWKRISEPLEFGKVTPVFLAVSPSVKNVSGRFFEDRRQVPLKKKALDDQVAKKLWHISEDIVNARSGADTPLEEEVINIGILGTARIAPFALLKPARSILGVNVYAVAEEYQPAEALQKFAIKHGIPYTYPRFDELLQDAQIEAVYIPQPISMHAKWVLQSIQAGKHVLCEKPLAANAEEAQEIHDAAQGTGLVVSEAMHFCYHPMVDRVKEILASGEIGKLEHIDASFSCFLPFNDFRFNYELGGGCTIDMGCYPIGFIRAVTGMEPEVVSAKAGLHGDKIDRWMDADLQFADQSTAKIYMGMRSRKILSVSMKIVGDRGSIEIVNFIKPEVYHRLVIKTDRMKRRETIYGKSTYAAQLEAFVRAVKTKTPILTSTEDAVKNMRVIDAIYLKAGLPVRGDRS